MGSKVWMSMGPDNGRPEKPQRFPSRSHDIQKRGVLFLLRGLQKSAPVFKDEVVFLANAAGSQKASGYGIITAPGIPASRVASFSP
jgi:hypothetical protein